MERMGLGWENRKISFLRTQKICPFTPEAASENNMTASGAILSADIDLKRSTRNCSASLFPGKVCAIRLQANGAIQLDRTPKRAISSAIDFDKATTPNLAA